jgi:glycosyltransferase involved in cell wall biosynthesis
MKQHIAIVTCNPDPNYIRSRTLRAAFRAQPDVVVHEIKNTSKGIKRYPETLWRFWRLRRRQQLDAVLLTFRGHELLPFVMLLAGKIPVWFDEFVPPSYALTEPYRRSLKKLIRKSIVRLAQPLYLFSLRRTSYVLADTPAHAEFSARTSHVNLSRYLALPVGADEQVFRPKRTEKAKPFQVFYYTTDMQPLHGIATVLEAAIMLQDDPVEFVLSGGKSPMKRAVSAATKAGAHITYKSWIPFDALPDVMRASQLSLGGPFGGTRQADHVVTGKTYQSLACGVATVIGDGQATESYFTNQKNCLKVPQQDAAALAETIRWALSHEQEVEAIARAGRALYEKEFSTAALARQVRPLIDSLSI